MIQTSEAFRAAIIDSPRRIELLAVADLSDPDLVLKETTYDSIAPWARPKQMFDKEVDPPPRYATNERGRWLLNGLFDLFPDDYDTGRELMGFANNRLCPCSRVFSPVAWIDQKVQNIRVLQAVTLWVSEDPLDGVPEDFTLEVFVNGVRYHRAEITGNKETHLMVKGFKVYTPTQVKLTVTKWSIPFRRNRIMEMVLGPYERWTNNELSEFSVTQRGDFSCLSLPYGSARLRMDNLDRRFDPRNKDSIFESIEERQGVELYIGVKLERTIERAPLGIYYQYADGWKTSRNELTMQWDLVDIIGLVSGRTFLPPDPVPTTLEGWIRAVVSQLGENFQERYIVDPAYADKPVTANSVDNVTGKTCGDIIRWACQASGTWPRADAETGKLTAEPLWNQGNKYDLDNLEQYPTMGANESLAALIFQLALPPLPEGQTDTRQHTFVVSGNSTSSEKTVTIINPFLHSSDQALEAARLILSQYGGNVYETTGRGNPSSEIGDVDTLWLDESNEATGRRMMQSFVMQGGVLRGCQSKLLQADGSYLYTEFAIMDADDGTFTAPPGVTTFRLVLSDGGQGGSRGEDGFVGASGNIFGTGITAGYGEPGQNGQGGKVWYGVINLNPGETVRYHRGAGGAASKTYGTPGAMGEHSTFGVFSSENGQLYENGYTDIANGKTFCRSGVPVPLPGTGDGGKGGDGGEPGAGYFKTYPYHPPGAAEGVVNTRYEFVVTKEPGPGKPGVRGASGFIMLTWERPEG